MVGLLGLAPSQRELLPSEVSGQAPHMPWKLVAGLEVSTSEKLNIYEIFLVGEELLFNVFRTLSIVQEIKLS